ncbi:mediator of RNA polymerase II transcription subunit 7-B-like [Brevipalpus obovatus]|uniref:mediator of RNA polymerase II transcription subunit 7-B-like n=1 Tax=Brevipalpus obovatus TaxID=246614 RepID=UPI003D9DDB57
MLDNTDTEGEGDNAPDSLNETEETEETDETRTPVKSTISSYPLPPLLIQWYTDENISKGLNPNPPKPITDGSYSMFAVEIKVDEPIIRSLENQGIKPLFPSDYNYRREIKKMNASLAASMLDLLDALIKCPESDKRIEKCTDIEMLFIQMHHLINEMRPHQARETIRVKLDHQRKQRLEMIAYLEEQIQQVIDIVNSSINSIPDIDKLPPINIESLIKTDGKDNDEDDIDEFKDSQPNEEIDDIALLTQLDALMCDIVEMSIKQWANNK